MSAAPSDGATAPTRNLLILQTPDCQEIADWETIGAAIGLRAPDIEVRIAINGVPNSVTRRWQATRPSLIFSPVFIAKYDPPRGKVYAGRHLNKLDELRRLGAERLAVPKWVRFDPGDQLSPAELGEYVIIKPVVGMRGQAIRLIRTAEAAALYPALSDNGRRTLIAQRYIDNRDAEGHQFEYRVITVFGEPMSAMVRRSQQARRPLAEIAADPEATITIGRAHGRTRDFIMDTDVLDFARHVAARLREVPVLGLDILRGRDDGKLWLLETNLSGQVWHFSSKFTLEHVPAEFRAESYRQFDVLHRTAEMLIARTRAEAT